MSIDRNFLVDWFAASAGIGFVDQHSDNHDTITLDGEWDFGALVKAIDKEQHAWGAA